MNAMEDFELYSWAKAHEACTISGPIARGILRLFAERDAAQRIAGVVQKSAAWKALWMLRAASAASSATPPAS